MATLGIELSDAGVHCVEIDAQGESRSLPLAQPGQRFPGYAYAEGGELIYGRRGQELAQIYPRRVNSRFLDELSFQSADLGGHYSRLSHSQLAYGYLEDLKRRLGDSLDSADRVVIAVPGHYLESNDKSEQRLGLLLGILQDLKLPVAGLIDMAAASLYSDGLWNVPEGDCIFHVDLLLHATHISVFHKKNGLERLSFARLPQHGFGKMLDCFVGALANRFLAETAFDVREDREIERAFHVQASDMLYHIGRVGEASLEVSTREKSRQMTISKDMTAIDLSSQVKVLTQMLLRAINDFAGGNDSIQVMLSDRAASIQGLKESIIGQGFERVQELPAESAAFGAANIGIDWEPASALEDARVETGVTLDGYSLEEREHRYNLSSVSLVRKGKSLNPTHIVCDGLAYELKEDGFVIGAGESEEFDLVVERRASGQPIALGRLLCQSEKWVLAGGQSEALDVESLSGVRAGDALEVTVRGKRKQLLLIHCMQ